MKRLLPSVGVFLIAFATSAKDPVLKENFWENDGDVYAIEHDEANERVDIGGDFTYVGPNKTYGAGMNQTTDCTGNEIEPINLAEWTFETSTPTTAGPYSPEAGLYSANAEVRGFHVLESTSYSNPVGNGSGESYSSNNWLVGDYYEAKFPTTDFEQISISWDQTRSSTGPENFQLQWSIDGVTFTPLQDYSILQLGWSSTNYNANSTFEVNLPAATANQSMVWVRFTSLISGTLSGGTNRIDNIILTGLSNAVPGNPCDDGDPCTINDTWDNDCNCTGTALVYNSTLDIPFCSIQDAIYAANPDDLITMGTGTRDESLDATGSGVQLSPGNSPGCINLTGNFTLDNTNTFVAELDGNTACTGYDQLDVDGVVTLGNASLDVVLGYAPANSETFQIITSDNPIVGTFAEGACYVTSFNSIDYYFSISYSGNAVTLTAGDGQIVHNSTQETYHCSIQAAIDAAVDNDVIVVEEGTYTENLNFSNKNGLTLQGAQAGVSAGVGAVRDENTTTGESIIDGTITTGSGTSGWPEGLTIDGFRLENTSFTSAIRVQGDVEITNCIVHHTSTYFMISVGGNVGTEHTLTLSNSNVNGQRGFSFGNARITAGVVNNNVFNTTSANLISESALDGIATVTNNEFNGPRGINVLTNNNTFTGNTFNVTAGGSSRGIDLYEVTGNNISGNAFNAGALNIKVRTGGREEAVLANTIENNALLGGIFNDTGKEVVASCNWFGTEDAGDIAAIVFDDVDFLPYLIVDNTSGTSYPWDVVNDYSCDGTGPILVYDEDPNTTGTLVSSHMTIQGAINAASTDIGYFVVAADGAFDEIITVDKPLTLLGANAGTACTGTRSTESIVDAGLAGTAFTIISSGVTINGFSIQGAVGISAENQSELQLLNNIVEAEYLGIAVTGVSTSTITSAVADNCVQINNRLDPTSEPTAGIAIGAVAGSAAMTISDNNVSGDAFYGKLFFGINTVPTTTVTGGTITGATVGLGVVNTIDGTNFFPSTLAVDGLAANSFDGLPGVFQSGIYAFTGGASSDTDILTLDISNVNIDGVNNTATNSAGISFSDFSNQDDADLIVATVTTSILTNNNPRGLHAAGSVNAAVTNSTFTGNGAAGTGYTFFAAETTSSGNGAAHVNIENCLINHPTSSPGGVTAFVTNHNGTVTANTNSIDFNGNVQARGASTTVGGGNGGHINATCNWWGTSMGSSIAALMQGDVNHTPWLITNDLDNPDCPLQLTINGMAIINMVCNEGTPVEIGIYDGTNEMVTLNGVLSASGAFQESYSIPAGTYDVYAKIDRYLAKGFVGVDMEEQSAEPTITLTQVIPGDIAGTADPLGAFTLNDNVINGVDLSLVINHYNTIGVADRPDLNCDNQVDAIDLSFVAFYYFTEGAGPE